MEENKLIYEEAKEHLSKKELGQAEEKFDIFLVKEEEITNNLNDVYSYYKMVGDMFSEHSFNISLDFYIKGFYRVYAKRWCDIYLTYLTTSMVKLIINHQQYKKGIKRMKAVTKELLYRKKDSEAVWAMTEGLRKIYFHLNKPRELMEYLKNILHEIVRNNSNFESTDMVAYFICEAYNQLGRNEESIIYLINLAKNMFHNHGKFVEVIFQACKGAYCIDKWFKEIDKKQKFYEATLIKQFNYHKNEDVIRLMLLYFRNLQTQKILSTYIDNIIKVKTSIYKDLRKYWNFNFIIDLEKYHFMKMKQGNLLTKILHEKINDWVETEKLFIIINVLYWFKKICNSFMEYDLFLKFCEEFNCVIESKAISENILKRILIGIDLLTDKPVNLEFCSFHFEALKQQVDNEALINRIYLHY